MIIFSLFLGLFAPLQVQAEAPFRICYFSLNDHRDFNHTTKFVDQLNKSTERLLEVSEFQTEGSDPQESFMKMVKSGVRCDGLVITGHNTGAWGGKRSAGKLDINFIEKLSCDPKYAEWFQKINATWLEGCRTLGVGEIGPDQEHNREFDADYHTNRVGQDLAVDGLTQTFSNLNYEFSNTLDQNNPMDSRYLRIFPNARVFGWTRSAPGIKAQSELSMLYHMAHTVKLLEESDAYPEDPDSDYLSPRSAAQYMNAVVLTLSNLSMHQKACEDLTVGAWINHGQANQTSQYAFDNPDLKSLASLKLNPDEKLLRARQINCLLKDAATNGDEQKISAALNMMNSDPDLLGYSFNSIISLYYSLIRNKNSGAADRLVTLMRNNPFIDAFLREKMRKNQVGLLRKIDYYRFYSNLTGQRDIEFENDIYIKSRAILFEALPEEPPVNRRNAANYRATIFQAVMKNGLASTNFYYSLLVPGLEADVQNAMIKNIDLLNLSSGEKKQMIISILRSPKVDAGVWANAEPALRAAQTSQAEIDALAREVSDRIEQNQGEFFPEAPLDLNAAGQQQINEKPQKNLWDTIFGGNKRKKRKQGNGVGTGTGGLY